jgi:plasmid stability protein
LIDAPEVAMAALTIRGLEDSVHRALKELAARHNRSMEAEARVILTAAVTVDVNFVDDWLDVTADLRGEPLTLPERSEPRAVDLT